MKNSASKLPGEKVVSNYSETLLKSLNISEDDKIFLTFIYLHVPVCAMRQQNMIGYGIVGFFVAVLLAIYIYRRATVKEGFDGTDPKSMPTATSVAKQSMDAPDTSAYGDATITGPKNITPQDMSRDSCIDHYRCATDVLGDFPVDTRDYTPYGVNLDDPATYGTEVNASSQLAMQSIRHPYYEMNLSDVIRGTILNPLDPMASPTGSASDYVHLTNTDVTSLNVIDVGNGGVGGVAYA